MNYSPTYKYDGSLFIYAFVHQLPYSVSVSPFRSILQISIYISCSLFSYISRTRRTRDLTGSLT